MARDRDGWTMLYMSTPTHAEQPFRFVMNYVECDLAEDLTLPQRRRDRAAAQRRHRHFSRRLITVARRQSPLAG